MAWSDAARAAAAAARLATGGGASIKIGSPFMSSRAGAIPNAAVIGKVRNALRASTNAKAKVKLSGSRGNAKLGKVTFAYGFKKPVKP